VHTDARCPRRRPERIRELVVRKVVDEAQPERVELRLRKLCERLVEPVEPGLLRLDRCGLAVQALENPEPAAGRTLETPSANGRRQDVPRNPEEPRSRRPARDVLEARRDRAMPARTSLPSGRAPRPGPGSARRGSGTSARRTGRRAGGTPWGRSAPHAGAVRRSSCAYEVCRHGHLHVGFVMRWREGLTMLRPSRSPGSTCGGTGVRR
jgi:hypothetical protein